jgi:hypothetical protein
VGWAGEFSFAAPAAVKTHVEADRAVDGLDDVEHGGFPSARENGESAEFAAARGYKPCMGERLEDFGEEALRSVGGMREVW